LGLEEEAAAESLWIRVGGQTNTGDTVMSVCYRPPHQEEDVGKAFFR